MSLSKKLPSLDEAIKKKIEAQLQESYPNSVEVQVVLHLPGVLEWLESQTRESVDASVLAHSTLTTILAMLQEKISENEQICAEKSRMFQCLRSSIQNAYTDKPIELVNHLLQIYQQIDSMVVEYAEVDTGVDDADQSSNTNDVIEDQSFDFYKNLEVLDTLLKENNNYIMLIQQKLKEREQLCFSQTTLETEKIKIATDNSSTPQDKSHQNQINKQAIIASLKPLYENIQALVSTKNKDIQSRILSQISEWNYNKQKAQVGWPVFSFSDFLQPLIPVCQKFVKILWSTHSQTEKLVDIFTKIGANKEYLVQIENMKQESRSMLNAFLKSCFVVDKQPPPTPLTEKVLRVSLRLLLGSQVLSSARTPTVTCSLHLDDDIQRFYRANLENVRAQEENIKNVKNNEKALNYDKQTDSFCVTFEKLKLNKLEKRKTKRDEDKSKLVTDQKSCLMFQTQIVIGTESFTIEAFSVPIVVMTNVSQSLESEATIFWDNAFACKDREPFISPDKVLLGDFLKALNQRWAKTNERELEDNHLMYLARKLFPGIYKDKLPNCYVTKQMFNKEHVKLLGPHTITFTFWNWFYKTMKLVKEFLIDEWRDNKIYGFIDKGEAENKLDECLVGTFLLRFSDSAPGCITIAYKDNMQVPGCNHVVPWTKEELKQKSFSDSLRDLQHHKEFHILQYLYPSIPKDQAFEMYYTKTDENDSEKVNPRYPKKAPIRVVRHDDGGCPTIPYAPSMKSRFTSASNFSSSQPSSFQNMSLPPSDARISESSTGNEQPFSPLSLSLDHDPLLSQGGNYNDPWKETMNVESDDPFLELF